MAAVPRVLHQIWMQGADVVPPRFDAARASWRAHHPTWEIRVWDERELRTLVRGTPWEALLRGLSLIQRADVLRAAVLERHGGVYADMDMVALRNIEPLLVDGRVCIGRCHSWVTRVQNSIAAAPPAHPAWRAALLPAVRRALHTQTIIDTVSPALHVMRTTGPLAWSRAVDFKPEWFHLWDPEAFFSNHVPKQEYSLSEAQRAALHRSYGYHIQAVSWIDPTSLDSRLVAAYTAASKAPAWMWVTVAFVLVRLLSMGALMRAKCK